MMFRNPIRDGMKVLLSKSKTPSDDVFESLLKLRPRESEQLKTVLELYDMEIHQKRSMPGYQQLKTMVKRSIDWKLRLRNFDARNERIETVAVVASRRGLSGIEMGQGVCNQWKAKGQCLKGDQCSFWPDEDKRAKRTPKTAPLCEPPTQRGRGCVEETGTSEVGVRLGRLIDSFINQNRDVNSAICASSPHRKVQGQPSKKNEKDGDKSAVAFCER